MRILFLIHSLTGGGAERVMSNLVRHFSSKAEVALAMFGGTGRQADYDIPEGIKVYEIGSYRFGRLKEKIDKIRFVKSVKREFAPDVTLSFLESGNAYNILSGGPGRKVVSIRNHTSKKNEFKRGEISRFLTWAKKLDRRADGVICVSRRVAEDQISKFGISRDRIRVIYNYVDREEIAEAARAPVADEEFLRFRKEKEFLFVATGRFDIQKGYPNLVKIFSFFLKEHPDAGLVILGRGSLEEKTRALCSEYGITGSVLMPGRKKDPFPFLTQCDAFVFPSFYEGFPNAVLEAMSCSLPVICDDCVGVGELMAPGRTAVESVCKMTVTECGILTPLLDCKFDRHAELTRRESEFLAAMEKIYEDQPLRERLAEKSYDRRGDFLPETILPQWEEVLGL